MCRILIRRKCKHRHSTKFGDGEMSVYFIISSVEKPLNPLHAETSNTSVSEVKWRTYLSGVGENWERKRKQSQFHYTQTRTMCCWTCAHCFLFFCWKPEAECRHSIPASSLFDVLFTCNTCASNKSFYKKKLYIEILYRREGIYLTSRSELVEKWKTHEKSLLDMSMTNCLLTLHNINARQMKYDLKARFLGELQLHKFNCFDNDSWIAGK